MDMTSFRYSICLAVSEDLDMRLLVVVTIYLYGDLDKEIDMKIPKGITLPESRSRTLPKAKSVSAHSI